MQVELAIIGAGIAGCSLAYFCKEKDILLLDKASLPATGGSGAAGAFISPKLGKKSALLELTNEAFSFAAKFYSTYFPNYFDKSGIIRLPKDNKDANNFLLYQSISGGKLLDKNALKNFGIDDEIGLLFEEGGVCDAQGLCRALIKDVAYKQFEVEAIVKESGFWLLISKNETIKAKKVVLATGYEGFEGLEYMGLHGIWGSRGDFFCKRNIKVCAHKSVSVSAKKDGIIKIGATHLRAKSANEACAFCDGKPLETVLQKAKEFISLDNLVLKETFCGMRSGSRDYFPVVGRIIDTKFMLEQYPQIKKGYNKAPLKFRENLFVFNGLGGRGFVFAPLLAQWLKEFIFEGKAIDERINPNRLFLKWVRKLC